MIKLERERKKTTIVKSFRFEKSVERLEALMKEKRRKLKEGDETKMKFASKWGTTKKQLQKETFGKCAYCETSHTVVAHGDVEHYRPKSVYWWLAYVYDNYLVSCQICNQTFKSDLFEFSGSAMKAPRIAKSTKDSTINRLAKKFAPDPLTEASYSAFEALHRAEGPLIPNPYIDDPEDVFAWEVIEGAKEVNLIPLIPSTENERIVEASKRIFGLDRPQLKRRRFKQWRNYQLWVRFAEDPNADDLNRQMALEFIDESMSPESEYAGMIRYFENQRRVNSA